MPATPNLDRLAFVDLETTGTHPVRDRITEIGVITVAAGVVTRWSSLVNPGCPISRFIQTLTGIDDAMVADAPGFADLADEIRDRLAGYTFVAHNARFDYGFLKNEFKRLGQRFQADVVCTVKLSRKLFPEQYKHNLDSLIQRHGLHVADRHRALSDAELIWQFWRQVQARPGPDALAEAIRFQLQRPALPPQLDPEMLDDIPETPGVYLFHGEREALLAIGHAANLRQRVLAHFNADSREYRLGQQTHRIEWRETVGELGARLLESRLIKTLQPLHNRKPRQDTELCAWQLVEVGPGDYRPHLIGGDALDLTTGKDTYGLFSSRREAHLALKSIAEANRLCLSLLGLEQTAAAGQACIGFQSHRYQGACVGKEAIGGHSARLMAALAKLKLKPWPYPGPVGIVERDEVSERQEIHVVFGWCHLGTAGNDAELAEILHAGARPVFDRDTYKLLSQYLGAKARVIALPAGHVETLE